MLKFRFEVEGNHGWLVLVANRTVDTQVYDEPGKVFCVFIKAQNLEL